MCKAIEIVPERVITNGQCENVNSFLDCIQGFQNFQFTSIDQQNKLDHFNYVSWFISYHIQCSLPGTPSKIHIDCTIAFAFDFHEHNSFVKLWLKHTIGRALICSITDFHITMMQTFTTKQFLLRTEILSFEIYNFFNKIDCLHCFSQAPTRIYENKLNLA